MSSEISITDQVFRVRQRALIPSKKYRDVVKVWGEPDPTKVRRKRVIIANDLSSAPERDVEYIGSKQSSRQIESNDFGADKDSLQSLQKQKEVYRKWLSDRMKMRQGLNELGLNMKWLQRKQEKTALESRVLKSMEEKKKPKEQVRSPIFQKKRSSTPLQGKRGFTPVIKQPSPAAIKIIEDHLRSRQLRLIDLFSQADKDKDWRVSGAEFRAVMKACGVPLNDAEVEELVFALDKDDSDNLDYSELVSGRSFYKLGERQSKVVTASELNVEMQPDQGTTTSRPQTSPVQQPNTDRRGSRASSAGSSLYTGSSDEALRTPTPTLLPLPYVSTTEKVTKDEAQKIRMKKRQSRKEKGRKQAKVIEKPKSLEPSTLGGETGERVDKYKRTKYEEYRQALELCHMHGVIMSAQLLERVLLAPGDKPAAYCQSHLYKNGLFNISTKPKTHPSRSLLTQERQETKTISSTRKKGGGSKNRAWTPNLGAPDKKPFKLGKTKIDNRLKNVLDRRESMGDVLQAIEESGTRPTDIYPPAYQVKFIPRKMKLSTGTAEIISKTDCWMTFEEYEKLTSSLNSKFKRFQLDTDDNAFWPQSLLDKLRICLDEQPGKVNKNSVFETVEKPKILPRQSYF